MKLYGVLYEDFLGEGGKGIDEELYTSVEAAANVA